MTSSISSICGKKLKEPLHVITYDIDGHHYASNSEYMIFADSTSEEGAMDCFVQQLEDMYGRFTKLQELMA